MEPREIVKAFERLGFSTDGAEDNAAALIRALAADGWSVVKLEPFELRNSAPGEDRVISGFPGVWRVAAGEVAGEGEQG